MVYSDCLCECHYELFNDFILFALHYSHCNTFTTSFCNTDQVRLYLLLWRNLSNKQFHESVHLVQEYLHESFDHIFILLKLLVLSRSLVVIVIFWVQMCAVCSISKTLHDYRSKYLSLESWRLWWSELVEVVRTSPSRLSGSARNVDTNESPAVEVLSYRNPKEYFAGMLICYRWIISQLQALICVQMLKALLLEIGLKHLK